MEAARSTAVLCKWSLIGLFRLKIVVWLNVLKWPDQAESGPLVRSGRMTAKRDKTDLAEYWFYIALVANSNVILVALFA